MLKERDEVNDYLEQCIVRYVSDKKIRARVQKECFDHYQMPFNRIQGILSLEYAMVELSDAEVFWILDSIASVNKKADITEYFTPIEIENYRQMKYDRRVVTFPLEIPAVKVNDTQWIGVTSAQELVMWRGSIMRYNKEIQRRLRTVVHKDLTYEAMLPRMKQVNEMVTAMKEGKFIPNDISINIYDDADFYFDEERKLFVINAVDYFDLTDGYSRLLAFSKVIADDANFNMNMELRIHNFTEDWASMFIDQQAKQIPIPKKDAKTYDMTDTANRITKRINMALTDCLLAGHINRGGRVDFGTFSRMIDFCFLRGMSDDERKIAVITVTKDVIESINALVSTEQRFLNGKFTIAEVRVMVYCARECYQKSKDGIAELFNYYLTAPKAAQRNLLGSATEKKVVDILNSLRR